MNSALNLDLNVIYFLSFQKEEKVANGDNSEKEYKPHNIPSRMGMKVPNEKGARRTTGRMNGGNNRY